MPSSQMNQIMVAISHQPGAEATVPVLKELTRLADGEIRLALMELTGRGWLTQVQYPGLEPGHPLWQWKITPTGQEQRPTWQAPERATRGGRSSSRGGRRPRLTQDPAMRRLFFGFLLLAALIGLVQVRNFFVYQSFEQGTCTILDGQVVKNYSRGGTYYTPVFTYLVHMKNGQTARANGYDAPTQAGFSQDGAQQIVDSYALGRSYACWYDPADPTHAALRFYGESVGGLILAYVLTALLSWIFLLFFGTQFYAAIDSIFKEKGFMRPTGCSLILTYFWGLLCLAALIGGVYVIVAIWLSA